MKNNDGKGLYEIGGVRALECGCIEVAEEAGYTLFVNPDCPLDNHYHPPIKGYQHKPWDSRPGKQ